MALKITGRFGELQARGRRRSCGTPQATRHDVGKAAIKKTTQETTPSPGG